MFGPTACHCVAPRKREEPLRVTGVLWRSASEDGDEDK